MLHRLASSLFATILVAACQVPNPAYHVGATDLDGAENLRTDAFLTLDTKAPENEETLDSRTQNDENIDAPTIIDVTPRFDAGQPRDVAVLRDTAPAIDALSGKPVVVAVGDETMRLVSFDLGLTWQVNNHVPNAPENRAHFGAGFVGKHFFAMGWQVFVSTDARTWQDIALPYEQWFRSVAYGDHTYMMVGGYGAVVVSTDLLSWQPAASPKPVPLEAVAFLNGQFAASTAEAEVYLTSDKGASWRLFPSLTTRRVMACDGAFRDAAECGMLHEGGRRTAQGHGVSVRWEWPTTVSRSTDGLNFTHKFVAPTSVRDFAFGFVP